MVAQTVSVKGSDVPKGDKVANGITEEVTPVKTISKTKLAVIIVLVVFGAFIIVTLSVVLTLMVFSKTDIVAEDSEYGEEGITNFQY